MATARVELSGDGACLSILAELAAHRVELYGDGRECTVIWTSFFGSKTY